MRTVTRVYNDGSRFSYRFSRTEAEKEIAYNKRWRPGCAVFRDAECVQEGYLGFLRCRVISNELRMEKNTSVDASNAWTKGFVQGFACAVSALIKSHGRSTESEELFRILGSQYMHLVDEYDRNVFRECGLLKDKNEKQ